MFTVLIAVGFYSRDNLVKLTESRALLARTHDSIQLLSEILLAVEDAETGQRGFVITGDDEYLEPYHAAVARVDGLLQKLNRLAGNIPEQTLITGEVTNAIREKLGLLKGTIDV
ncbi:MAG TPA: CHASE3 domain-containing protein, partial [Chroococcales cyanobacterium]